MKKVKRIKWGFRSVTLQRNGYSFLFTQKVHPEWGWGHYSYILVNEDGHIINTVSSCGGPSEPLSMKDIKKNFSRMMRERGEQEYLYVH